MLTYALEFRGEVEEDAGVLRARGSAPPCTHETRLLAEGVRSALAFDDCGEEALLEAEIVLNGDSSFTETVTIDFGHGHQLWLRSVEPGRLSASADEHLRHGTAVLDVLGGTGQFAGATGRITSNFVLSDTGELTDNQFGLIFIVLAESLS